MTNTRSKWPAAKHLQQAAAETRQALAGMPEELQTLKEPPARTAAWLDETALEMAWLAPYRPHEIGYLLWQLAVRIAHGVLNLPDADSCPTCYPERKASS